METILQFALLGLGIGGVYALTAQGLLIIYRGSGLLNFAQGAIGAVAAFVTWDLGVQVGLPMVVAVVIGIATSALLGAVTHLLIMRRLKNASPLARTVASLAILIILQALIVLRYGNDTIIVKSFLPTTPIDLFGGITISLDRIILIALAAAVSAALWAFYKFTHFGLATTAVAENQRAASSLGLSPDKVATINWMLGSALAGLAAVLVMPIVQLQVMAMTNLVLAALAVAMIANFTSFGVALAAGLGVGVVQALISRFTEVPGLAESTPFFIILVWMVLRGRSLPLRDSFLQKLPSVGSGRVRPPLVLFGVAVAVLIISVSNFAWQDAMAVTLAMASILLSVTVVTGYAGQISLGQFALAGMGAYVAGRLSSLAGLPFLLALLIAILVAVPLGVLFALPAVRTRGVNLAIVTLGLGAALSFMVFGNSALTGGYEGTTVQSPDLFGFSIDPILYPDRYAYFALVAFVVLALIVANVRRGRSGRRMLSVRTNERAAAALGVSVVGVKLFAFAFASALAAVGGVILAFRSPTVLYTIFDQFASVNLLAWSVIGGVGFIYGSVFGALFSPGSLGTLAFDFLFEGISVYIPLIGGVAVLFVVLTNQDGAVKDVIRQFAWLGERARRLIRRPAKPHAANPLPDAEVVRVPAKPLEVNGLTVRYGGVVAVSELSLTVQPGKVVGLIGPNGAGKTSAIDAITGFTTAGGQVVLGGENITRQSAARRSRNGVSRSFQSLELFDDMTVRDNLRVAADTQDWISYVRDLVWPVEPALSAEVIAAIRAFGLEEILDERVDTLSYGQRRLLSIARAVATSPSVLLLDEPAAGLGERESVELAKLVRKLPDSWGMGILLVEHDMNFVMSICDEIYVMDFGRPIAHGTPEEIRSNPHVIAAYLGVEDPPDQLSVPSATVPEQGAIS